MTAFELSALVSTGVWLLLTLIWFRRSRIVLVGGLLVLGLYSGVALAFGMVRLSDLGLSVPKSWLMEAGLCLAGLALALAYSPIADRIAARWFKKPPELGAFKYDASKAKPEQSTKGDSNQDLRLVCSRVRKVLPGFEANRRVGGAEVSIGRTARDFGVTFVLAG